MADPPASPKLTTDPADDSAQEPAREPPPRTPRWVKMFGIIAVVLILAAAVQFILGIRHGPGLHSFHDLVVGLLVHLG